MSRLMEELIAEERAEAAEVATEIAKRMLQAVKYSYEEIAEITQLFLEEVETLSYGLPIN